MKTCNWGYKAFWFVAFGVAYNLLYILPNFHPIFHPMRLPLLGIDYAVPFIPWTVMIYLSEYVMVPLVVILHRDLESFQSQVRITFGVLILCGLFFMFWPTTYPRPVYPTQGSPFILFWLNVVAGADTPNNCFPSMHVAMSAAATWSLRRRDWRLYLFFGLWAFAIFVSTLTTKQHYAVDILGGLGVLSTVAILEWGFFETGAFREWLAPKR
jgi:membrane-associated phospholipid phosphatase